MSMEAIRQLNSGGLKLKSNFSAKSVAANISANRSAIASKYSIFGSNRMFTPANRMGGTPKYASSSMISRGINHQSMRYVGGDVPVSSASYSQNVTMGTSSAFNAGNAIGMILGAAPSILGALNQIGVFGSGNDTPKPSASQRIQSAFAGAAPAVDVGSMSSAGLPAANSYGVNFASTFNSVEAYMKSDTMDPAALRSSAQNLVTKATNDLNSAGANFSILQSRQADAMSNQTKLQDNLAKTEQERSNAKKEVGTQQGVLKSAKNNRAQKDEVLSAQDADYKKACNDLTNKETVKDEKQKAVGTCNQELASAESALSQATSNRDAAKKACDAIPEGPEYAAQKAAAKEALAQAEKAVTEATQKRDEAKNKLNEAKNELSKAEEGVTKARQAKEDALKKLEDARTDLKTAIDDCRTAETQVQSAQTQFDKATESFNQCDTAYTQAKAAMEDASGVIAQCSEYEETMKTLNNNLAKATKLQNQANKAAANYEKKHEKTTNTLTKSKTPGTVSDITENNLQSVTDIDALRNKQASLLASGENGTFYNAIGARIKALEKQKGKNAG